MSEKLHLEWFRSRLMISKTIESADPSAVMEWLDQMRVTIKFDAKLIGLNDVRGWSRDDDGNVRHATGQFFGIEGVRTESGSLREVSSWDQPIYTQIEGGVLALFARETSDKGIEFLLQAKAEPGNIGTLQLCPTVQSTWSNINRAHAGKKPPMVEAFRSTHGVRFVYRSQHNEEGGRFWKKSNENSILFIDDDSVIETDMAMFCWASLSQIKAIALMDNQISPFVKTIIAPL
jgi:oxidase EvaA